MAATAVAAAPAAATPAAAAAAAAAPPTGAVAHALAQTKAVFESGKEQYDEQVRAAVLGYDDLSVMATAAIGATANGTATNVLCVGCGTGNEVLAIARAAAQRAAANAAAPALRVTGADPAAAMIALARKRVSSELSAEQQKGVALLNGFVHDLIRPSASAGTGADGAAPVPAAPAALGGGTFDGATSVLVMHLVPDVEGDVHAAMATGSTNGSGKLAYLQSITHCLKPGARLFLVDGCGDTQTPDGLSALHAQMDVWVEYVKARGAPPAMTDVLKANALKWGKIVPVARVLQLLAAAGFVDVAHVYRAFHFNGFVARYAGPAKSTTAAPSPAPAAAK